MVSTSVGVLEPLRYWRSEPNANEADAILPARAFSNSVWLNDKMQYSLENMIRASMTGQSLTMLYTEKIREEASAAYSVMAQASLQRDDYKTAGTVLVYCPMKPEKGDIAKKIMREEVEAMTKTVDAEKLAKVKEYMLKAIGDEAKTNNYWLRQINRLRLFGVDTHTTYMEVVNAQTPESVAAFVKELVDAGNFAEVVMMPEE